MTSLTRKLARAFLGALALAAHLALALARAAFGLARAAALLLAALVWRYL